MPVEHLTALKSGLVSCHGCGHLSPLNSRDCNFCTTKIYSRKAKSLERCQAFLLAAIIFYIPANFYPIMTITSFGQESSDTILSGVIYLINAGQVPIAMIIFLASVFIPVVKILVMVLLTFSVQSGMTVHLHARTHLYKVVEFVGRWSMIDIFVISILVGLVQLQAIATVTVGPGAICFAIVVILTMLATESFDTRLIWDKAEEHKLD